MVNRLSIGFIIIALTTFFDLSLPLKESIYEGVRPKRSIKIRPFLLHLSSGFLFIVVSLLVAS